jgi:hypothetical protein
MGVDPRIREAIHKQDFDSSLEDFARSAPPGPCLADCKPL